MKANLKLIGGKLIKSPKSENTRPTSLFVREAIFNILSNKVKESYWLDLFSGTGSIACEAYNHGAKKILAIEKNRANAYLCKTNLFSLSNALSRENDIEIICWDVFSWIKRTKESKNVSKIIELDKDKFDFIYLDPPYLNDYNNELLVKLFKSKLVKKNTTVIFEHSKNFKIPSNNLWEIKDIRSYGQTTISFLLKV
tara:strand:- start:680 stop:1270 length:591 start_codon:yes stop_codon:yes gene_type:complete